MINNGGTLTITMMRNNQQLIINSLSFSSSSNNLNYKHFKVNSLKTTFITVAPKDGSERKINMYAVVFNDTMSNTNYQTYAVSMMGSTFSEYDITKSTDITVYESLNGLYLKFWRRRFLVSS